jgi:hypothetical protein
VPLFLLCLPAEGIDEQRALARLAYVNPTQPQTLTNPCVADPLAQDSERQVG